MHEFTKDVEELAQEILAYSLERLKSDPPLDGPRTAQELFDEVGNTITPAGLGCLISATGFSFSFMVMLLIYNKK